MAQSDLSLVVAFGGLVVTAAAAWFAARASSSANEAARAAHRTAQGQLLRELLDRYSAPEMLVAINKILIWNGEPMTVADDFDRARRLVSHHFQTVATLLESGALESRYAVAAAPPDAVALFCGPVERMEKQNNPGYNRNAFDRLADLYGGRGMLPHLPSRV